MADIEWRIDAIYRLPLEEFTAARTELARSLTGADASRVKALKKPTVVPWAVNQLYWTDRRAFDRLLDLGQALRKAQVAALEGRKADVREAAAAHRSAVSAAAARAVQLSGSGGAKTKAEPLARMLEAISLARTRPEHPGRFTEVLQPAAFEALEGVAPRATTKPGQPAVNARVPSAPSKTAKTDAHEEREKRLREQEAREEHRRLEADVAAAEHALERAQRAAEDTREAHARADAKVRQAEAALVSARERHRASEKRER